MFDAIRRIVWFIVVASVLTYVGFVFIGSVMHSDAAGTSNAVMVRDELAGNRHYLSGMIMVPSPCDELFVRTQEVSSTTYFIHLDTWREPSVTCPEQEVPRSFHTLLFAPAAGVNIMATINEAMLPIVLVPVVRK